MLTKQANDSWRACFATRTPPRGAGINGEHVQTHNSFSLRSRDWVPRPYSGGTATMAMGRYDVTSEWLTNGIPWKTPLLLTLSSALQKPASPPTPVGMEDRTGFRQRWPPLLFRSVGRITLGKRTPSRGKRYGATSRIRRYHVEITHMDWPRAVLHTGVSEVDSARLGWDSYTAERAEGFCQGRHGLNVGGAVPWKNTHVGSPKGNHYTRAPSPAQGLTLGNVRVLDLASGAPPHLTVIFV